MEYQLGSLADLISGTKSVSSSKTKIVIEPKKKLLSLKYELLKNSDVPNSSNFKEEVKHFSGKRNARDSLVTLKGGELSELYNERGKQLQTVCRRRKSAPLKEPIFKGFDPVIFSEKEKRSASTSKINLPDNLENSKGNAAEDDSRNYASTKKLKIIPRNKELLSKKSNYHSKSPKLTKFSEESEHRTIFVKNLPHSASMKEVKAKFKEFGPIECARFRCAVSEDIRQKKKVVVIKKLYHPQRSNICAFIRYKDPQSVEAALKAKNLLFNGYHLFVDRALGSNQNQEQKKAIFLGNVPFDAEENSVYKIFEQCGEIVDIRIVRDNKTGFGKGFAFVTFASADGVELALSLNGVKLKDRELRVSRSIPPKHKLSGKKEGRKPRTNIRTHKTNRKRNLKVNENSKEKPETTLKQNKGNMVFKENKRQNMEYQGQKISDKKRKRKANKEEIKKKVIARKLTAKKREK